MQKDIQTLKVLALRGAVHEFVGITTAELGKELGISQQTASNRVLGIVENGLAERKMGVKNQEIRLTRKGVDLLRKELADYQLIFAQRTTVKIRGRVSTGMGEGSYYVGQKGYLDQFQKVLGFRPFKGTLNIRVSEGEMQKLAIASASPEAVITVDGFEAGGRSFGKVEVIMAGMGGQKVAIVIPRRSHHSDVIEVLARVNLRKALGLEDGDEVELAVRG